MTLHDIQSKVHVAKDKKNDFGGYNYRTAEGILAAIKSALPDGATVTVSDSLQEVAGQIFVSSTATITFSDGAAHSATGHAMHPLTKKGMDPSQITGAASSYARKYALAGLVALDDGSADPDGAKEQYQPAPAAITADQFQELSSRAEAAGVDTSKIAESFGISHIHELPADKFSNVMKRLQATIDKNSGEASQ